MSDTLLAQYRKQMVVADRNSSALLRWASYTSGLDIPSSKPSEDFVRTRLVSERVPEQIDSYVQRTLSYFLQDPNTVSNINAFLNAFNTEAVEEQLANFNDAIINGFISRFAASDVSEQQVQDWYTANGFA